MMWANSAPRRMCQKSLTLGANKRPGRQLCPPSLFCTGRSSAAYQVLGFQLTDELADVSHQFQPGCVEFFLQRVGHLIKGELILQHSPDLHSNRIETETNPLLDVQQNRSIFTRCFPASRGDCDV